MSTNATPLTEVEPITGVRDLRSALEWYDDGGSRGSDGIPIQITGVWDVICGKPHRHGDDKIQSFDRLLNQFTANPEKWDESDLSHDDVARVVGLLRGLQSVESEYRYYREDRERSSKFDVRTQCWVGLYHVTEKTTIMTYLHKSPGMGMSVYSNTGVVAPRKDIDDKLRDDVFYNEYDYTLVSE